MSLTQLELNSLSVAKDVGKAFGLLAGLASDRLPTPVILLIGSIEGLIGYGAQWLVVSKRIQPLSYWKMCIFLCLGGNSTTWMNTAVLVTCIRNFRSNRGPVSGILKGYVGLSTAIFTDLCAALFGDDPAKFLAMLALIPFAVCLTAIVFLRETPPAATVEEEKEESKYFNLFNVVAVIVAVYLLAYSFIPNPSHVLSSVFSVILLVLLASPLAVPVYAFINSWNLNRFKNHADVERQIQEPLLREEKTQEEIQEKPAEEAAPAVVERTQAAEEEKAVVVVKRRPGLAVMNNMGQIGLALGYADVSLFVSMTSIWGFFGRIISGTVSEHYIKKAGTPRPLWNAASQILMAAGYILMAVALPGSLYIGSIVVGVCYGVRVAVSVPTASELFGLKYFGLIYNILILNLPLGSFLFSGLLAGFLYDAEATPTPGGGNTCVGAHCYRNVFIIMAIACVIGFGLDVLLGIRTKKIYTKIYMSRRSKKLASASNLQ
ncbi:MAJOR FACILITATOR SUPERFAMILY PROTEIN [Salix viminalis]|uniref:MAJOR FACILITATOR SUPERFAMILY PROTEIN n=1 Tax=Salix viminalis TaxID=40686 RepID=A0A9Q0NKU7_SALVM|nr:MAJOR FACILITATOR SUPERFAMILY PROTEIN [Salix viminalis]